MRIPIPLAAVLIAGLAACSSPTSQAPPPVAVATPTVLAVATPTPNPSPPAATVVQGLPHQTRCASSSPPPVPAPRAASDVPGAPLTVVTVVGTVCSAANGRPIAGARV